MPTVEARVPTDRASRYLVQFCRHAGQMGRMRHQPSQRRHGAQAPPAVEHVDWSDTAGTVHFGQGRCSLRAEPDTLTVRVDAEDEDALRRLAEGIARRLETIGRRDRLSVRWNRTDTTPEQNPAVLASRSADGKRRRRLGALGWVALAALVVVVHLGVFGGALLASVWGRWGINVVLAIVVVKVLIVGVHLIAGRVALRHGVRLPRRWTRRAAQSVPATPEGNDP